MIKDYSNRHPDWISAKNPPYATFDARYDIKLSAAKEWLGRNDRGKPGSAHVYRDSHGKRTSTK